MHSGDERDNDVPGTGAGQIIEPPVPADVDISGLVYFPINVERLVHSELWAIATPEELGAALALWVAAFRQRPPGSVPDDDRVLAAFSRAGDRWPVVRAAALRGFRKATDGRLYHQGVVDAVSALWAKRKHERERKRAQRDQQRGQSKSLFPDEVRGTSADVPPCGGGGGGEKKKEAPADAGVPDRLRCAMSGLPLPSWLKPETWNDFVEHRRAKRARMTPRAVQLIWARLEEFQRQGHDPAKAVYHAIEHGHTGIFWNPADTRVKPITPPAPAKKFPPCVRCGPPTPGHLIYKNNYYCQGCYVAKTADDRGEELRRQRLQAPEREPIGPRETKEFSTVADHLPRRLSR